MDCLFPAYLEALQFNLLQNGWNVHAGNLKQEKADFFGHAKGVPMYLSASILPPRYRLLIEQ